MTTPIETQALILSDLWMDYRQDEEFQDFIQFNDLGLPLAYLISNQVVEATPASNSFISETFSLLLAGLGLEDTGYEELEEILDNAQE